MYEEEREFCWTDLFIKVIVILIIILFAVWLFSLANKRVSNSLEVITDNIFSENINKMQDVGKNYFTSERLPKNVGDVEKVTLEKMYEDKLLLTLKDSEGNACSSKNSYVSVEKTDNLYQMKVYLECGKIRDYVVINFNCYNYCTTDMCDNNNLLTKADDINSNGDNSNSDNSNGNLNTLEYQYSKTIGGAWSSWGNFSDWSTTPVLKSDMVDVETKVVKENYIYDKTITENKYMGNATCGTVSGYTLVSNVNGICSYSKIDVITSDPICPTVSGYALISRIGFTCNYSKTITSNTEYTLSYYGTGSGSYVPKDTATYHYVLKSADYIYNCDGTCGMKWYYIYTIYKKIYKTETVTTTKEAICPNGYYKSGSVCAKNNVSNITREATCPKGQYLDNGGCYKEVTIVVPKNGTRDVTYYRYRLRSYIDERIDYKWSSSKDDRSLLDSGYRLTGKTRNKQIGGK